MSTTYTADLHLRKSGDLLPFATKAHFTAAIETKPEAVLLTPFDARMQRKFAHEIANGSYSIVGPFAKEPSWTATLIKTTGSLTVT